jgi:RNase P subunit RPR2
MRRNKKKSSKVAKDHIAQLYNLALHEPDTLYQKRYISLIRKYVTRHKISLDKNVRRSFCKGCNLLYAPGVNCRVRVKSVGVPMKVITCDCGTIRRIVLGKK